MPTEKVRSIKNIKMEIIEWIDASASVGWADKSEVARDTGYHVQLCVTVGFNVYEDKDQIILAGTTGYNNSTGNLESNNRIAVPKAWLKDRRRLI